MLEICANSFESAQAAKNGGADRVELCSVLSVGGVTPSTGLITMVRRSISIDINVLIRPRGGDFLYNSAEKMEVLRDIEVCAELGVNGVVIGALTNKGRVDMEGCSKWVKRAHDLGLSVTFHRAIDRAVDIFEAMEEVISLGCERILTSGGFQTAIEGRDVIKKMVELAGERIIIMPGSGVNPSNIAELASYTKAPEFHFSASKTRPSGMLSWGGIGEPETITVSDQEIVAAAVKALEQ